MTIYVVEGIMEYEGGTVIAAFKDKQRAEYYCVGCRKLDKKQRFPAFDGYCVSTLVLQ